MEKTTIAIKLKYGDEFRRFSLETPSFDLLRRIVQETFPEVAQGFKIKYKDDEGDMVTITRDKELVEATGQSSLLHLFLYADVAPSVDAPKQTEEKERETTEPLSSTPPSDFAGLLRTFAPLTEELDPKRLVSTLDDMLKDMKSGMTGDILNSLQKQNPSLLPLCMMALQTLPNLKQHLPNIISLMSQELSLLQQLQQPQQTQQPQQPQQTTTPTSVSLQQVPLQQSIPPSYQPVQQPPSYQPPLQQLIPPSYQPTQQPPSYQPLQQSIPPSYQPVQQPPSYLPPFGSTPTPPTFSFAPTFGDSGPSFTFGQPAPFSYTPPPSSSSLMSSISVDAQPFGYWTELQQLQEMGFANVELNRVLLVKNGGDMVRTVQDLTGGLHM